MNLEKVVFGFFITLAAALNFGFWTGPIDNVMVHNGAELAAALVASLVATVLKFGDRTQLGAVHLATSLVADLQLVVAAIVWVWAHSFAGIEVTNRLHFILIQAKSKNVSILLNPGFVN